MVGFVMQLVDNLMVYGNDTCTCMDGQVYGDKTCPKCHGTQRTKGGKGKGHCNACLRGTVVDTTKRVPCGRCNGTNSVPADRYTAIPKTVLAEILNIVPIRIHRSGRKQTFNEAYLGYGMICSVTDYGEYKQKTDEQLVEYIKKELSDDYIQACKLLDRQERLCTSIGVYCNNNGYSIMAEFDTDQPKTAS